ncbi:hypothetical protein GCM10027082_09720 [Comamonas humi]
MGLLQILLIFVWAPSAALIAFVAVSWLGHGAQAAWNALCRTQADAHSTWPLAMGGAAGMAALVGAVITFPDQAVLRHALDKLLGYGSTRIVLTLRQDDPATREALVETLRPFMEIGGREIRYRVSTRHGSYTETDEVPSHYRFADGRLEIAAGGIVAGDRLAVLQPGFAALAQFPTVDAIAASVPATVHLGKERIAVDMLPRTAQLIDPGSPADGLGRLSRSAPGRCHLEVQALFSSDAFPLLLLGGHASGEVEIQPGPGTALRDTRYRLAGLSLVRGERGRMAKELASDRTRIHGVLRLLPPGLDLAVMDCDTALGRLADPALAAAAMLSTFPALAGRIRGIAVTPSASFSPWYQRGWTAVPSQSRAEAGTHRCELESHRSTRALVAALDAHCMDNDPDRGNAETCAPVRERLRWTRSELGRCMGPQAGP